MTQPDPDRLARAAYAAYGETTGGLNYAGLPMPAFDDLGEQITEAWRAACRRVSEIVRRDIADDERSAWSKTATIGASSYTMSAAPITGSVIWNTDPNGGIR
jgi:hypothetical protein